MELATIGHNNPPSDTELLQTKLKTEYADLNNRYEKLKSFVVPAVVEDDERAKEVTDHMGALKNLYADVKAAHKKEKDPFIKLGDIVQSWHNVFKSDIDGLSSKSEKVLLDFNDKKRQLEETRRREIAIAEQKKAALLEEQAIIHENEGIKDTANELINMAVKSESYSNRIFDSIDGLKGRTVSQSGATSSSKLEWVGEIVIREALDISLLLPYFTDDQIQVALNKAVKDGVREIKGTKIYQKSTLKIRT